MTRRLLICLLALVMVSHTTGCTSGGGSGDSEVAESNDETFAEEGEGDFADDSSAVADDSAVTEDSVAEESTTTDDTAVADAAPADDAGGDLSLDGDEGSDVAATTETTETTESTDVASGGAAPSDDLSLDDPGAGALPEDVPADVASTTEPENITDNPAAPSDAGVFEDPGAQASATTPDPAPVDTTPSAPSDTSGFGDQASNSAPAPRASSAPAVYSPYLKVKDAAFTAPSGETLNRVYLARPRDTAKGIAQKVYGDASRSKDLVKWNSIMKRGVRTGDKIYYTSATNPSDTRMQTYYEEAGIPAQTYVAKDSDNFRETAKSLLGFSDAWKEVYATNANLSEKSGRIPTGLELRYWGEQGAPVQSAVPVTTAQTEPPTTPDAGMPSALPDAAPQVQPPTDVAANTAPPSDPFAQTPPNVAANGAPTGADPMAPPPPMPDDAMANANNAATAGGVDPMAPPPIPPTDQQAVAPPAPKPVVKRAPIPEPEEGMDADTTMALGVGGVLLLAAAILFVVIRKKRATRMDLGQTQV